MPDSLITFDAPEGSTTLVFIDDLIAGYIADKDQFSYSILGEMRGTVRINHNADALRYVADDSDDFLRDGDINPDPFQFQVVDRSTGLVVASHDIIANVTGVSQTDLAYDDTLKLVVTHGQSLSIGYNNPSDQQEANRPLLSETSRYAEHALTIDTYSDSPNNTGFGRGTYESIEMSGFQSLKQRIFETHTSGMSEALIDRYIEAGETPPTVLNIMGGNGGKTIQELALQSTDVFDTEAAALAATEHGDVFVLSLADGTFDIHINVGGTAQNVFGTMTKVPVYIDNIVEQIVDSVEYAEILGKRIDPDMSFVWIQGQSNRDPILAEHEGQTVSYNDILARMIDRIETQVEARTDIDFEITTFANQVTGYGRKDLSFHQLDVIDRDDRDFRLGVAEHYYNNVHSGNQDSGQNVHLTRLGYRLMGEELGHRIADVAFGTDDGPILINQIDIDGVTLDVTFGGLAGTLSLDYGLFASVAFDDNIDAATRMASDDLSDIGIDHLGFSLRAPDTNRLLPGRTDPPEIISAEMLDDDTVRLTLDKPLTDTVALALGMDANPRFSVDDPELRAAFAEKNPDASPEELETLIEDFVEKTVVEGTPLRDSVARELTTVFAETPDADRDDAYQIDGLQIHEYAPIQSVVVGPDGYLRDIGPDPLVPDSLLDEMRARADQVLEGTDDADVIKGSAGSDFLSGGNGDDELGSRDGGDVFDGGEGSDRLRGGFGDDHFVFDRANSFLHGGKSGHDTLHFTDGGDHDLTRPFKMYRVDALNLENGLADTVELGWGTIRQSDDSLLTVHGEASDTIVYLGADKFPVYQLDSVEIDGEMFNVFNVRKGNWLDETLYVDQDVMWELA